MAATTLGNPLTTRVEKKDSQQKTRTISGNTAIYRYTQKTGVAVTSPAIGDVDPVDATIVLKEINFQPQPGGGFQTVELVYGPPNPPNAMTPPVGTVTYEADANAIEIPIEQHPKYNYIASKTDENGIYTPVLTDGGTDYPFPGVTSYLVPQPTFTRTEVMSSFTFTEANIIENVGLINNPTGMTSPTSGKWLKTRLSIRKNGNVVEKNETWQYNSADWKTPIYS